MIILRLPAHNSREEAIFMKKLWLLLPLTILAAAMLTGCVSSADALATPTPKANGGQNNLFPGLTTTGTPGPAATNRPSAAGTPDNGGDGAAGIQTPEDARKASKAMAEAVERLSEVDEAYVLALGDTALVGLKFGPEYQGKADDRIKKMVLARVQTVDKTVRSVAVTDDVKWMQEIQALTETLGSAVQLDTLKTQMDDLVNQIKVYTE